MWSFNATYMTWYRLILGRTRDPKITYGESRPTRCVTPSAGASALPRCVTPSAGCVSPSEMRYPKCRVRQPFRDALPQVRVRQPFGDALPQVHSASALPRCVTPSAGCVSPSETRYPKCRVRHSKEVWVQLQLYLRPLKE
jgi:hypothetical protein